MLIYPPNSEDLNSGKQEKGNSDSEENGNFECGQVQPILLAIFSSGSRTLYTGLYLGGWSENLGNQKIFLIVPQNFLEYSRTF